VRKKEEVRSENGINLSITFVEFTISHGVISKYHSVICLLPTRNGPVHKFTPPHARNRLRHTNFQLLHPSQHVKLVVNCQLGSRTGIQLVKENRGVMLMVI